MSRAYGLAETRWEIRQALAFAGWRKGIGAPMLRATYRDRLGETFRWTLPLSAEVLEDAEAAPEFLATMGRIAQEDFRLALDGRYDDPGAFWPSALNWPRHGYNRWTGGARAA